MESLSDLLKVLAGLGFIKSTCRFGKSFRVISFVQEERLSSNFHCMELCSWPIVDCNYNKLRNKND